MEYRKEKKMYEENLWTIKWFGCKSGIDVIVKIWNVKKIKRQIYGVMVEETYMKRTKG